jgi:hypothetical protein
MQLLKTEVVYFGYLKGDGGVGVKPNVRVHHASSERENDSEHRITSHISSSRCRDDSFAVHARGF